MWCEGGALFFLRLVVGVDMGDEATEEDCECRKEEERDLMLFGTGELL